MKKAPGPDVLKGMRRGIEKESLRVRARRHARADAAPAGARLGAHPPAHHHRLQRVAARADHRRACRAPRPASTELDARSTSSSTARIGDEMLWVLEHALRPAGRRRRSRSAATARSNVGRAKSVYRMGLSPPLRPAHADDLAASTTTGRCPGVAQRAELLRADPQLPPPRRGCCCTCSAPRPRCARASSPAAPHELQPLRAGHAVPAARHLAAHGAAGLPERRAGDRWP